MSTEMCCKLEAISASEPFKKIHLDMQLVTLVHVGFENVITLSTISVKCEKQVSGAEADILELLQAIHCTAFYGMNHNYK